MLTKSTRCEGAFLGQALASKFDPSVDLAVYISKSLVEKKAFDGPDILSRYLYSYHTKPCAIGEMTKYIYEQAKQSKAPGQQLTQDDFRMNQLTIDKFVELADKTCGGRTSGCGPAQRSFPLAFCSFIPDDDLYDFTVAEAKLTHFSPIAGQVAGIVNCICRALLKDQTWANAVKSAFTIPNLHPDVTAVFARYGRFATPSIEVHPAYAPTVLNAALHYVAKSNNAETAIVESMKHGKPYCLAIVGILAGARWGIPMELFQGRIQDEKIVLLRETASSLSNFLKNESGNLTN